MKVRFQIAATKDVHTNVFLNLVATCISRNLCGVVKYNKINEWGGGGGEGPETACCRRLHTICIIYPCSYLHITRDKPSNLNTLGTYKQFEATF